MKIGIIDRFEGDFAVVELDDMTTIDVPIKDLPEGACEGKALCVDGDKYTLVGGDPEREKRIGNLMDELFN